MRQNLQRIIQNRNKGNKFIMDQGCCCRQYCLNSAQVVTDSFCFFCAQCIHDVCGIIYNYDNAVVQSCFASRIKSEKNKKKKAKKNGEECCCAPYCNGCQLELLDSKCFTCQQSMHNYCGVLMYFEGSLVRRCPNCFLTILENENNANHNFSMDEDNVVIIQNDLGLSNKIPTSTNEQLNDSFAGKKKFKRFN